MLAIPWYFINVFGQHSLFGILYAAITAISIFWVLYTGTLIDRFDRKNIFIGINIIGGSIFLSISAYGFYSGMLNEFLVALAFAVTFFVYNIHFPNLYAFAQQITEKKDYSRILSYLEVQHQLTSAGAGAVGAILLGGISWTSINFLGQEFDIVVKKWELHEIFLLDGCTYFIALILVALIKYQSIAVRNIDTGNIKERFNTGINYLKDNPVLFLFGALSYSIFITVLIINFFLMPTYINNFLNADIGVYSIFEVFFAGGSVLAGLSMRFIFKNTRPSIAVIILSSIGALYYFIGMANTNLFLFYLLSLMLGLCNAGTRIMRSIYIFNYVPNDYIGRAGSVFHVYQILFRLMFILLFSLPFFAVGTNIIYSFFIFGLFITVSVILLLVNIKKIITDQDKR